jgi:transglutaminase-like putative cysteine protease
VPFRWLLFPFALRWMLALTVVALALFLLTPRRDGPGWDPLTQFREVKSLGSTGPAQTGFTEEINLNRTGQVEIDDEVAMTVVATEAQGQPKLDLSPEQRWRGTVLDNYADGLWTSDLRLPRGGTMMRPQRRLPDLGPTQYFLTFTVEPQRAGGLFLADPIVLGPSSAPLPLLQISAKEENPLPIFYETEGTILPLMFPGKREFRYRQVLAPQADPDRTHASNLTPWYIKELAREQLPALENWTADLLDRLVKEHRSGLTPANLPSRRLGPGQGYYLTDMPDQWQPVARALTDYLAHSGDYSYTLDLQRSDHALDPVMDFLVNVKQGHCERYATALALMLRSQGIPARLVKGFRGAENQGDGTYLVRHSHAHSWVEALVPRGDPNHLSYDWLSLDPTPAIDAPVKQTFSFARWWESSRRNARAFWHDLIVEYNASNQADLLEGLMTREGLRRLLIGLGVPASASFVLWLARRLRRRQRVPKTKADRRRAAVAFYARLVALLARFMPDVPHPAQTPREFGTVARQVLTKDPATVDLADVPLRVAELFYRVRFGGRPLDAEEDQALEVQLDRLAAALASR